MSRSIRVVAILVTLCLTATLSSPRAYARAAGFSASTGVEYLKWSEDIQPRSVEERGPLAVLALGWSQPGSAPVRLAYRGRFYAGGVDYRGTQLFPPHLAATGTSRYEGTTQEAQLRSGARGPLEAVSGLGIEVWKRRLSQHQREDFTIGYVRLGLEASQPELRGWTAGAGVRCPLGMSEDPHLETLGFDQHPMLEPKAHVGVYGSAGYRFGSGWSVLGTLEDFRFDASREVELTADGVPQGAIFQPGGRRQLMGIGIAYAF